MKPVKLFFIVCTQDQIPAPGFQGRFKSHSLISAVTQSDLSVADFSISGFVHEGLFFKIANSI